MYKPHELNGVEKKTGSSKSGRNKTVATATARQNAGFQINEGITVVACKNTKEACSDYGYV